MTPTGCSNICSLDLSVELSVSYVPWNCCCNPTRKWAGFWALSPGLPVGYGPGVKVH